MSRKFLSTVAASERRAHDKAEMVFRQGATKISYDQSAWGIMYGALVNGLNVDPANFQLVYPYIAWDWPTQSTGYIGAAQYDILSTIPQWSAMGKYTSTGERFDDQYSGFLNVISPDTTDPDLRGEIDALHNVLVDKTNLYNRTMQQAKDAYDTAVPNGKPTFTDWLGTIEGRGWQSKLNGEWADVEQAQRNYNAKVNEARTPNLDNALEYFSNHDFYAKLNDPGLSNMPAVPNWTTAMSASNWTDKAKRGDVPGGAIAIANSDASYDFSKTWAEGSTSVGSFFWGVKASGSYSRIDEFATDASLSATINFEGVEEVSCQPSSWYSGVSKLQNGPYVRGYSKYGSGGDTAVFGKTGFLPMLKTGMYVAYKPTFTIQTSESTFKAFEQKFKAATSLRIGPFTFGASGGSTKAGWTADSASKTFTGTSDSEVPSIFGFTINRLP